MARRRVQSDAVDDDDVHPEGVPEVARQGHLPEMEPRIIPEIEAAAEQYVTARNAWQRKQGPMLETREILMVLMRQHNLKHYEYNGSIIDIVGKENVVVKSAPRQE